MWTWITSLLLSYLRIFNTLRKSGQAYSEPCHNKNSVSWHYSIIFNHIQSYSGIFKSLCNACICRNLAYSEYSNPPKSASHTYSELCHIYKNRETPCNTVNPESWPIDIPGIFRILAYWHSWNIQNPGLLTFLEYSESWPSDIPGMFRILAYWHSWNIQNPGLLASLKYSESWPIDIPGIFRILAYWHSWDIQNPDLLTFLEYSESWPIDISGIFRTLAYWHLWNIQNPYIFKIRHICRTLSET